MNLEDVLLRDTRANQPAAGDLAEGTLFYVTDEQVTEQSRSGAWVDYSDGGGSSGDVVGPGSATDNAITRFDGTTGKLIQNSAVTIGDTGIVAYPDDIRQTFNPGANASGLNVGAQAGDPGTPVNGDLVYNSTTNELRARINGAWVSLGAGGGSTNAVGPAFTAPVDGDFAWINQGTASVDTTGQGIQLIVPAGANAIDLRIRKKAAPSTPYTITAAIFPTLGTQSSSGAYHGIGFRQSSDGKLHLLLCYQSVAGEILSIKFTDPNTFSALYNPPGSVVLNTGVQMPIKELPPLWFRIGDDGVNRTMSFSVDGYYFFPFHSIGRTDFLTADEVLFFNNAQNATQEARVRLVSWLQT